MRPAALTRRLRLALVGVLAAGGTAAAADTIRFDCTAGSVDCPEVVIEGDPVQVIPGVGASPFRGYGDPSMRLAPGGGRLWMTYSYVYVHPGGDASPIAEPTVEIHLASSDDGGDTWRLRRVLWRSRGEQDPAPPGGPGLSVHEVSALTPFPRGNTSRWFAMHLRYFEPLGAAGRRPASFHFRLRRAGKPTALARGREARLGGPLTDAAWATHVDLSTLDRELSRCDVWTEPSLFAREGELYLVAQCLVVDPAGKRRRKREFLGVFASDGRGRVDRLEWRWLGRLTTFADARELGGHVLTQAEVTTSRDGTLLLLVTPKRLTPEERHRGCRVLELDSLDPPRLRRRDGRLIVRADLRSPDSTGLGPGLCAYEPASATGILLVRTEVDLDKPEVVFRLHATGVHP